MCQTLLSERRSTSQGSGDFGDVNPRPRPARLARSLTLPTVALLATVLAACTAAPTQPTVPAGATALAPGAESTLQRHRWRLESATDARDATIDAVAPSAARAFTFAFAGNQVMIDGGCNAMRGGFLIPSEGKLAFGRMAATLRACDLPLMQADAALAKLVAEPMSATLAPEEPPRLRLTTPANDSLVLVGELTPEARYGPPTIVFLEVAPSRVSCNHPLIRDATCLQVRDRAFDAQGLPAGTPGPWRVFYGSIEGYTHQEGVRNVLRVKRFHRPHPPADVSAHVYVLDLVVESEVVRR
jgi:heat shock protein HslJ